MSEALFYQAYGLLPDTGRYTELVPGLSPEAAGIWFRSGSETCLCGTWQADMPACSACGEPMCRTCESGDYPGLCVVCEYDDNAVSYWRTLPRRPIGAAP